MDDLLADEAPKNMTPSPTYREDGSLDPEAVAEENYPNFESFSVAEAATLGVRRSTYLPPELAIPSVPSETISLTTLAGF